MEDRYLFRGKRFNNGVNLGEFVHGHLSQMASEISSIRVKTTNGIESVTVDTHTVGQCTGLRDKNGTLIFEGDIVKTKYYGKDDDKGRNFSDYDKFAVVFFISRFCLENKTRRFIVEQPQEHCEIIGNIHDNSELLERSRNDE